MVCLGLAEPEAAALLRAAQQGQDSLPDVGPGRDRHNLPLPMTSFVARAGELGKLEWFLRESCLVTITGAGGCGKTRLALEVARAHVDRFADGVWLVELASLADASLVTQTIAATLGIPSTGRPADEMLTEFLRNRQALLVLDNCEHIIEKRARCWSSIYCGPAQACGCSLRAANDSMSPVRRSIGSRASHCRLRARRPRTS